MKRTIEIAGQQVILPAFVPVHTFGDKYPLDRLVRPYLPRIAQSVMVSYHYAKQMRCAERPKMPLWIDSGGFACLFENARVVEIPCGRQTLGAITVETEEGPEHITPSEVLAFQEEKADLAFALDFPIPPGTEAHEAQRRLDLTLSNATWALQNRRKRSMLLYACIQGWDKASYLHCAKELVAHDFDGFAIGGLVPRAQDKELIKEIVSEIRALTDKPLHVFGIGKPQSVKALYEMGVDSVDSSSPLKMAAEGKLWGDTKARFSDPSPAERLHLALCNIGAATATTWQLQHLSLITPTLQQSA